MNHIYFIILRQNYVPDLIHQKMVCMIQSPDIHSANFRVEMSHLGVDMDTDSLDQEELFVKMMEPGMQAHLLVRQLMVNFTLSLFNLYFPLLPS